MRSAIIVFVIDALLTALQEGFAERGKAFPSFVVPSFEDIRLRTFMAIFPGFEVSDLHAMAVRLQANRNITVNVEVLRNRVLFEAVSSIVGSSSAPLSAVRDNFQSPFMRDGGVTVTREATGQEVRIDFTTGKRITEAPVAPTVAAPGEPVRVIDASVVVTSANVATGEVEFNAAIAELRRQNPGCVVFGMFRPYKTPEGGIGDYRGVCTASDADKDQLFAETLVESNFYDTLEGVVRDPDSTDLLHDVVEKTRGKFSSGSHLDFSTSNSDLTTPGFKTGISLRLGETAAEGDMGDWYDEEESVCPEETVVRLNDLGVQPLVAYLNVDDMDNTNPIVSGDFFVFPNNAGDPSKLHQDRKVFVLTMNQIALASRFLRSRIVAAFADFECDSSDLAL